MKISKNGSLQLASPVCSKDDGDCSFLIKKRYRSWEIFEKTLNFGSQNVFGTIPYVASLIYFIFYNWNNISDF